MSAPVLGIDEELAIERLQRSYDTTRIAAKYANAAGYGSEVRGAIDDALRSLDYALRLVEGKA